MPSSMLRIKENCKKSQTAWYGSNKGGNISPQRRPKRQRPAIISHYFYLQYLFANCGSISKRPHSNTICKPTKERKCRGFRIHRAARIISARPKDQPCDKIHWHAKKQRI